MTDWRITQNNNNNKNVRKCFETDENGKKYKKNVTKLVSYKLFENLLKTFHSIYRKTELILYREYHNTNRWPAIGGQQTHVWVHILYYFIKKEHRAAHIHKIGISIDSSRATPHGFFFGLESEKENKTKMKKNNHKTKTERPESDSVFIIMLILVFIMDNIINTLTHDT